MSNLKPISHLDINLARKTFKNLRDRFMKIRKEYRPSGSAGGEPIEPTWPFFKQLLFLSPFNSEGNGFRKWLVFLVKDGPTSRSRSSNVEGSILK